MFKKHTPILLSTLLFLLVALVLTGVRYPGVQAAPTVISTFPYTQDFETFTTCSTTAGAPCALPPVSEWVNAVDDDIDWTVDTGGTTSGSTGPSGDHNPGTAAGQ